MLNGPNSLIQGLRQVFEGLGQQVCGSSAGASFHLRTLEVGHYTEGCQCQTLLDNGSLLLQGLPCSRSGCVLALWFPVCARGWGKQDFVVLGEDKSRSSLFCGV